MAINNAGTTNGNVKNFYVSILILLFVIILTLILKFYDSFYLKKQIDSLEGEKNEIVKNIENIRLDEKVVLYSMIKNNSVYLDKKHYLSEINVFINTLKDLSNNYDIKFDGFSYFNGQIKTKALASSDSLKKSYRKVYDMMSFLRTSKEHIFALDFIDTFIGQDDIIFNVNFSLR